MSSQIEFPSQPEDRETLIVDAEGRQKFAEALANAVSSLASADLPASQRDILAALTLANTRVERAAVCCLQIDWHLRRSEVPESVSVALSCLSEFGLVIPLRPDQLELEAATISVWERLYGRSVEELVYLPKMENPEVEAVISVLSAMTNSAQLTDERLLGVTLSHMVNLTFDHGITKAAVLAFGLFGFFLSNHFGRYQDGLKFCEAARSLVNLHGFREHEVKAISYIELVAVWARPLRTVMELTKSCIAAAATSHDIPYSCYAHVRIIAYMLAQGDGLRNVSKELDNSVRFVEKASFAAPLMALHSQRAFVSTMMFGRGTSDVFDNSGFDVRSFEARFVPEQTPTYICFYWILKAQASYTYGDFAGAVDAVSRISDLVWSCTGHLQLVGFHFFSALALAAMYDHGSEADRAVIVGHVDWLARWADTCPETFKSKHLLGLAEIARIDGDAKRAERFYEQAIDAAARFGLLADEALACEVAARFYHASGMEQSAKSHLLRARDCYLRWDAKGKVAQLEGAYPDLLASKVQNRPPIAGERGRLETVLEISQSMSSTIGYGPLLEVILKMAMDLSGAERATLIDVDNHDVSTTATASRHDDQVTLVVERKQDSGQEFSRAAILEVTRTLEPVNAADGAPAGTADQGNGLRQHGGHFFPLVKKSRLIGILHLSSVRKEENSIATLMAIAPHAAIALDNAKLFAELEMEKANLAEREHEFRMANDTMPSMTWSADANGANEWFNKEWYEYTGLTPEQACNGGWKYVFHPDDRAESAATWHRIVTKREVSGLEARKRRHDGEYRWFIVRAKPHCDATGRIVRCYGAESDIDDLKRAEILLAGEKRSFEMMTTEQPLSTILDSLSQTLFVLTDASFVTIMLQDEEGRTLQPGGGHKLPEGFSEAVCGIPVGPEFGSCGTAAFRQEPVWVDNVDTDPRWDCARDLVERFGFKACWSTPIMSGRGSVFGTIAVYSNTPRSVGDRERQAIDRFTQLASFVLERKLSEDALKKSEAMLAEGQRISRTGSWAWNVSTDKLEWSEEHGNIFGYHVSEVGGTIDDMLARMRPEEAAIVKNSMKEAVAEKRDFQFEYQATLPDGNIIQLLSTGRAVIGASGDVTGYVGTTMDITERKRVESELLRSAAHLREVQAELEHVARATTMGELAASIAHEVNQPLTGIVASGGAALRWLSKATPDVIKARESLKNVIDDGRRASEIVTRIRKMFRKEMASVEPIAIAELVGDVVSLTRGELQKNKVALKLEIPDDTPAVPVDRVQLQQVFVNLILNALEAMSGIADTDRTLNIDVASDGEFMTVGLTDNGPGVSLNRAENIFRPFETSKVNGMGMGLSICRTIIESHGGQMRLARAGVPGCRIEFTLPIKAA
ncbi:MULTISPECIES: PAS domain-containing protein [unclassified Rhizobium]|uniref:PAS domain-containing protein n=1 Tax=unclassified Rhizobium TaxID=2613769 RepID=UPI001ADB8F33|nr:MULTISPECIES: PAS domain-containing protein [unclassified Rhizobium]MBO9127959.1 PAS domain-containing protein [Rhizobium sp. 16-488-2b]MBO9178536.1 PAS domain-containing protein [Rhizobium sp. 16-488-2a]